MDYELKAGHPKLVIAGVDEVGRGPLAGPVVAAAVIVPAVIDVVANPWVSLITDSKLTTEKMREQLVPLIEKWAVASSIAFASVEEIDQLNIYHASHLAMCRAIERLSRKVDHALVDGNVVPRNLICPGTAIIKGDQKCLSIAAASILAKVWRDRYMTELDRVYPGYGFAKHKGYPTPDHLQALRRQGTSVVHRKSFAPVSAQLDFELS